MRPLPGPVSLQDPRGLLAAWEAATAATGAARGPALVGRAAAGQDVEEALAVPVSVTGATAARLYIEAFGEQVAGVVPCPHCGSLLDVTVPLPSPDGDPVPLEVEVRLPDGRAVLVRCPTTQDLLAAAGTPDPETALLGRCVRERDGGDVGADRLGASDRAALDEAAERLAGVAATVVRTSCPACDGAFTADVDVADLLWRRVAAAAGQVLVEVATLSAAYGWSELDVLAMTPARRRAYLDLAGGAA